MKPLIAIDPGTTESAFVVWDGCDILEADTQSNESLRIELVSLLRLYQADCAIEMVASYGMAVGKSVFETVLWVGRFFEVALQETGIPAQLVYRMQIKSHHCHSGRAKDANIRQVLIDKYGPPGTKKDPGVTYGLVNHEWAAFAIATYVMESQQQQANAPQQGTLAIGIV